MPTSHRAYTQGNLSKIRLQRQSRTWRHRLGRRGVT
jgi:hypothetical protein